VGFGGVEQTYLREQWVEEELEGSGEEIFGSAKQSNDRVEEL